VSVRPLSFLSPLLVVMSTLKPLMAAVSSSPARPLLFPLCRCFGSDCTPGVAPQGVFRSRTVSPTVAKWFVLDARGTMDSVYMFGPL
jgi:hypothetical protein